MDRFIFRTRDYKVGLAENNGSMRVVGVYDPSVRDFLPLGADEAPDSETIQGSYKLREGESPTVAAEVLSRGV